MTGTTSEIVQTEQGPKVEKTTTAEKPKVQPKPKPATEKTEKKTDKAVTDKAEKTEKPEKTEKTEKPKKGKGKKSKGASDKKGKDKDAKSESDTKTDEKTTEKSTSKSGTKKGSGKKSKGKSSDSTDAKTSINQKKGTSKGTSKGSKKDYSGNSKSKDNYDNSNDYSTYIDDKDPYTKSEELLAMIQCVKDGKQPRKPNKDFFDEKISGIQEQIEVYKEKIRECTGKIEEKNIGKETYDGSRTTLLTELKELKSTKSNLLSQKRELRDEVQKEKYILLENKKKINYMEKLVTTSSAKHNEQTDVDKILSEDVIDKQISRLEFEMQTRCRGNISIMEENRMILKIKKLKARKPVVREYMADLIKLKEESAGVSSTVSVTAQPQTLNPDGKSTENPNSDVTQNPNTTHLKTLDAIEKQVAELNTKIESKSKDIDQLKSTRDSQVKGLDQLYDDKKKHKNHIWKLTSDKNKLLLEKKNQYKCYKEYEESVREIKEQQWKAEKMREKADYECEKCRRELEKPNPFVEKNLVYIQTIDYCKGLLGIQEVECNGIGFTGMKKEGISDVIHSNPDGYSVMASKKDRGGEMFCTGSKKKRGLLMPKSDDKENNNNNTAMNQVGKGKKIKHTADTLCIFANLKLSAPMSTLDLPDLIQTLQKTLNSYELKARQWGVERKSKLEKAMRDAENAKSKVIKETMVGA